MVTLPVLKLASTRSSLPSRLPKRMLTPAFVTAKSSLPSPLKSPTASDPGPSTPEFNAGLKVPSPLPSSMLTLLLPAFATARSSLPSPLKFPATTEAGDDPARTYDVLRATEEVGLVISRKATFEVPPPGLGLTTFTHAVPALAMSVEKMVAFNCAPLTTVVARALPFHFTTEPETKPVPFTVNENPAPPGLVASGTSG